MSPAVRPLPGTEPPAPVRAPPGTCAAGRPLGAAFARARLAVVLQAQAVCAAPGTHKPCGKGTRPVRAVANPFPAPAGLPGLVCSLATWTAAASAPKTRCLPGRRACRWATTKHWSTLQHVEQLHVVAAASTALTSLTVRHPETVILRGPLHPPLPPPPPTYPYTPEHTPYPTHRSSCSSCASSPCPGCCCPSR